VSYTYDELGRVATRGLATVLSSFLYDSLGRLSKQSSPVGPGGAQGDFTYTAYDGLMSRPIALTYPNGQTTQYAYFPDTGDHRLQQIKHQQTSSGPVLSQFDYTSYPV